MRRVSGKEPLEARSPVRMRLVLSLVGIGVWTGAAALLWWGLALPETPRLVLTLIALGIALAAVVSAVVASVRIRQRRRGESRNAPGGVEAQTAPEAKRRGTS